MFSIEIADVSNLEEILALQKLAYQSEAELLNNYEIPPLTENINQLIEDFETGIIFKVKDVETCKIIGSIRAHKDNGTIFISKLFVHPQFQNSGIGKCLLTNIETFYPGYRYELFTSDKSLKNIMIYEKAGYKKFKKNKISDDLSFIYLEKELTK